MFDEASDTGGSRGLTSSATAKAFLANLFTADSPPRWLLLVLVAAVLAFRGAAMRDAEASLHRDSDAYDQIAYQIREHGQFAMRHWPVWQNWQSFPTAYRPPLYPLVLAAVQWVVESPVAVGWLHVVLGTATVCGAWKLARMWALPAWAALFACLLVAVDPLLLNLSRQLFSETLAAFLATWALVALSAASHSPSLWRWTFAGFWIGLCVLVRPTFLVWLLAVVLMLLIRGSQRKLIATAVLLEAAFAVLAPWAIRNYLVFGRPIITTTHGGYTLLLGNNPSYYEHLREGGIWDARAFAQDWENQQINISGANGATLDELASDAHAYRLAWQAIRDEPWMFVRACANRVTRLWGVLPQAIDEDDVARGWLLRHAVAVWYTAELLLAAYGLWSWRQQALTAPWVWGVLLLASFTAVHLVFWTDMRMRAPLTTVVALLAAQGLLVLASKFRAASHVAASP